MKRIAATTLFAIGLVQMTNASSQDTGSAGLADTPTADSSEATRAAGEQARAEAARRLRAQPSEFNIVAIEAVQWSDSSLGCRRPGEMYLQVVSSGYTVVLERQGQRHRVNVAGSRAVLCNNDARGGSLAHQPVRARGLQQMTALARQDLANRLRLDVQQIRVVNMEPQRWTDSEMNCSSAGGAASTSDTSAAAGAATGFRLTLSASGRSYFYHTDLKSVRACPPIEAL
jgi:hypothetical protein